MCFNQRLTHDTLNFQVSPDALVGAVDQMCAGLLFFVCLCVFRLGHKNHFFLFSEVVFNYNHVCATNTLEN